VPDIGLTELIIIGLVLFLVVGPERFPEFFGQVAGMIRKTRQWFNETRQTIRQETDALKRPIIQAHDQVRDEIRHATGELKVKSATDKKMADGQVSGRTDQDSSKEGQP